MLDEDIQEGRQFGHLFVGIECAENFQSEEEKKEMFL